jgi:uncharacterized protein YjbJ (UPF0337 family)
MKDKIEGTLKEQKGKLEDDPAEVAEGKAQQHAGDLKGKINDKLDDVDDALSRDRDD